jgi:hypothetical protein
MTTYTWAIDRMYTVQQPDTNYVVNVLWTLTGTDGTHTASIGGHTIFESEQESAFVPFDQLTEATVVEWVKAALGENGIANYEANVQGQINSILNPPVSPQNTSLPWSVS